MASEYDCKFEDMKKYIPFLESMIKRLENNASSSNPRQAQLDKIRSLRDLLLDKKKRMKMENLLKCEQVLVNLYAKVEHSKETIPLAKIEKNESRGTDNSDLEAVRNKLKTVAKAQSKSDTLPEIARASEREGKCEPGSKEPALFQRRPNKSLSPVKRSPRKEHESNLMSPKQSKRYTRVLVSPERWSPSRDPSAEKPLFSRRSPRRSPRRTSPNYYRKEKKKSNKSRDRKSSNENLNITLKVPEESLNSLNTDDILSRIITCSDGDVDITTLRELRTQILGELKQTGTNDDISELILKSYSKKTKPKKKKKHEVEEGELSDSESEVIESVYGNFIVMDKDKKQTKSAEKGQQRKIQICLVVADKGSETKQTEMDLNETGVFQNKDDFILDAGTYQSSIKEKDASMDLTKVINEFSFDPPLSNEKIEIKQTIDAADVLSKVGTTDISKSTINKGDSVTSAIDNIITDPSEINKDLQDSKKSATPTKLKDSQSTSVKATDIIGSPSKNLKSPKKDKNELEPRETIKNSANFYKPQPEEVEVQPVNSNSVKPADESQKTKSDTKIPAQNTVLATTKTDTEIPLLNEPHLPPKAKKDVLSEIDILQALKNEILSETIPIAPGEGDTPALHQPKLSKVAPGTEVSSTTLQAKPTSSVPITKKRISIENYKNKSGTVVKSLFSKKRYNAERDEMKKQSLKLTEKECERFNLTRLSLDDDDEISDYDLLDNDNPISIEDIYSNLAPKSPDHEQFDDDFDNPVLIPTDPIKPPVISFTSDVDMRSLASPKPVPPPSVLPISTAVHESKNLVQEVNKKPLFDPRLRRDISQPSKESPKAPSLEGTPRSNQFPNIPLLGMTPVYTPSYAPSMTPIRTPNSRTYEMTPTHQSFEIEEPSRKYVYAPTFISESRDKDVAGATDRPVWELNRADDQRSRRDTRAQHWEVRDAPQDSAMQRETPSYNPRNDKFFDRRDGYSKQECPSTPGPSFGWSDGPSTSANTSRRHEAPMTPNHPFGRSECPTTPIHPFGRSDCPSTPIHPFGRTDCPSTPVHPFGRSDCPSTPNHPFGRSDCPATPSHPFGRSDYKDPRLNRRQAESRPHYDENESGYYNDRNYRNDRGYHNQNNSYKSRDHREDSRKYDRDLHGRSEKYSNVNEHPRHFEREKSIGRSEQTYSRDFPGRYDRSRKESNQNRYRDDNNELFSRDYDRQYEDTRRNQREKSIGRNMPDQRQMSRARSVGRNEDNSVSVKSHVGNAFTIDTSVNATFQKFLESGKGIQVFDYSSGNRRQRATSVGRSLHRENSVGRSVLREKSICRSYEIKTNEPTFMDRSKRASSVGRSLKSDRKAKTFTEIKADFKSFKLDTSKFPKTDNSVDISVNHAKEPKITKIESFRSVSHKDERFHVSKQNAKPQYSPRKNNRDPRMRRDQKEDKNRYDKVTRYSIDRRHSGIVYSNDNIAKGTIMGTGFGVKNYKIPKIKRPEPELPIIPIVEPIKATEKLVVTVSKVTEPEKKLKQSDKLEAKSDEEDTPTPNSASSKKISVDKTNDKKGKTDNIISKDKNKLSRDKPSQKVLSSDDDSDVRVTRSCKKNYNSSKEETLKKKTRRIRKIYVDSDSDETETKYENKEKPAPISKTLAKTKLTTKQNAFDDLANDKLTDHGQTSKKVIEPEATSTEKDQGEDSFDSSFGIEDLEMFSGNIGTDPVINSINDLIADLDKDLNAPKSSDVGFSTEVKGSIALDNQEENTLGDISELIEKDLNETSNNSNLPVNDPNKILNKIEPSHNSKNAAEKQDTQALNEFVATPNKEDSTTTTKPSPKKYFSVVTNIDEKLQNIDETVSTTQSQKDTNQIKPAEVDNIMNKEKHITSDGQSLAPDSTIAQSSDITNKPDESLPDSTIDIHSEVSSDVTSTLNDNDKPKESADPSTSHKEVSAIDSFGSLLSILQDKSKIKELLSMLGDKSGDSEKIKKKLVKLSEIVSDDEDTDEKSTAVPTPNKKKLLMPKTFESSTVQKEENKDVIKDAISPENEKEKEKENKTKSDSNATVLTETYDTTEKESDSKISEIPLTSSDSLKTNLNQEKNEMNEISEQNINEKPSLSSPKIKGKTKLKGKTKKGKFAKGNKFRKKGVVKAKETKPNTQKAKKMNRELQTLQNDLKEMYMCNDVLNANGVRNCRLKKLVDNTSENTSPPEEEPVVVLEKFKDPKNIEEPVKKGRKKPGPKSKVKPYDQESLSKAISNDENVEKPKLRKPGPKSRTKQKPVKDCYDFDSDSLAESNTTKESDINSSDSESESVISSSSESSDVLPDNKKKPKKKRSAWQTGVIKTKHRKKKEQISLEVSKESHLVRQFSIPDVNCFTDKQYCFQRGVVSYECRLCHYSGTEIVSHYKKQHAHTEVPLSRMDPETARKAIQQCEEVNFQTISKIPTEKYTCRFCYKEFSKNKVALENFFWHVVSTHTGEYKHLCYECVNVTRCPFNLDIPPPPKEIKGQLIGYICGKCNFTQISLENLKTHVIVRHNDEQTEVFTINLGVMTQKAMKAMLRKSLGAELKDKPRTLRSSRSNVSLGEASDDRSEITGSDAYSEISSTLKQEKPDPKSEIVEAASASLKRKEKPGPLKSKLRFEIEENEQNEETSIKHEEADIDSDYHETPRADENLNDASQLDQSVRIGKTINATASGETEQPGLSMTEIASEPKIASDIFEKPHFKLNYKESGAKEYVCCINGEQNHYKTTLLISLKKHVQFKHTENWDGFCCLCKVIVTLQGVKCSFKDCLTHFLDKHIDDFPVMEKIMENTNEELRSSIRSPVAAFTPERTGSPRTYITVRPLSDLITDNDKPPVSESSEEPFTVIENIVSLGNDSQTVETPQTNPIYPSTSADVESQPVKPFQYEEVQAEVMSKKHRIVLDAMMPKEVLVRVFKCAGRFCSFTSDSAEDALVHASAHKQLGGEGALDCAYCNFDAFGNAIDLVMHVFKEHARCHYSCTLCFYRAAAEQLVGAHFMKAHGSAKAINVFRVTNALGPVAADTTGMLPREKAVPHYICNHGNGACKFKTYTPGKYCDHMDQKHNTADSHPCNLCEVVSPTAAELVRHLKDHGLKLYQCTWCVFGASTEMEMLTHASALHPNKHPQAYLRIITNKDGFTDLRVLPLMHLNKSKFPVEDVIPSKVNENATKEAERSIELEKLINHSSLMLESKNTTSNKNTPAETPEVIEPTTEIINEPEDITDVETAIEKSILSSPQKPIKEEILLTVPVKQEPKDKNQRTEHIIYCLDSDDDETSLKKPVEDPKPVEEPPKPVFGEVRSEETIIDLSDDEPESSAKPETPQKKDISNIEKPTFLKLSSHKIFKCPECKQIFRNVGGFKRHTNNCCVQFPTLRCPHTPCPIIVDDIQQLVSHYNRDHLENNQYNCGLCKSRWSTLSATKKHLKEVHNVTKFLITSHVTDIGTSIFTITKEERVDKPTREMPKRKSSIETPKKFGINDIDKLPLNPILDSLVYCEICEFSTKVRLNMVRHLQQHAERQPVPQTAPVNPVPHLETNEMHFDRMVNLASSSAATRAESRLPTLAPEMSTRFPKYVPERERYTCGAKGCLYISVNEAMLRIHWDTLHSGAVDYHCVHCPPHQQLDTSKILTANRIMSHLKMHDANLYACSSCIYYHHRKAIVEKHISDIHKDKAAVQVIREDGMTSNPATTATPGVGAVGTMDLKPWQCGLCSFKSMLRQSVVEHCSKQHQTKMQYKCFYCPFRTSTIENISKHQSNAHANKPEDVFYYYYREGTVPDENGIPRWQKQRQKTGVQESVKVELEPEPTPAQPLSKTVPIDLNLVKKEVDEETELSLQELILKFGQFCEPNGISYKCPLCKIVSEYTRDAMQSHLYEELKYRRWSCAICPYKAYHRPGLNEHMSSEHSRNFLEPTELPVNKNIEKWVSELLNYQLFAIEKKKANPLMSDQSKRSTRMKDIVRPASLLVPQAIPGQSKIEEPSKTDHVESETILVQAFGVLGAPKDNSFCCPKCNTTLKDEDEMRNHLESELTKIRWCCTICTDKFATFHEAQFHCKSHPGPLTRPKEAVRDPVLRTGWVSAVIDTQKKSMKPETFEQSIDLSDTVDNSLLVVRYEEPISAEELTRHAAQNTPVESRKRPADSDSDDSDDNMVIHEPETKKINSRNCPYCDFVSRSSQYKMCMKEHILRHYNLRSLSCVYCPFNSSRNLMKAHVAIEHADKSQVWSQTEIPNCLPSQYKLRCNSKKEEERPKKVCLYCETGVFINELSTHLHGDKIAYFGDKGDVVVKCCICLTLRPTLEAMQIHYNKTHSDITKLNYAYYRLQVDKREVHSCGICYRRFTFIRDLRIHHTASHGSHNLSYTTVPYRPDEDDHETRKRKLEETTPTKNRVAKKSTSKLPHNAIAKKSTTKLPMLVDSDSESDEEYSYYGTKPDSFDKFVNIKTIMPMCNSMVEIDLKKLRGILKIDPKVVLKDIAYSKGDS